MSTPDFIRSRLDAMIDLHHALAVLANRMSWAAIAAAWPLAASARHAVNFRPFPCSIAASAPLKVYRTALYE